MRAAVARAGIGLKPDVLELNLGVTSDQQESE